MVTAIVHEEEPAWGYLVGKYAAVDEHTEQRHRN